MQVAVGGEWSGGNGASEFVGSAEDDFGAKSEAALDGILNFPGQRDGIFLVVREFAAEDDIATLNEGARAVKFEGFVEGAQGVHLDLVAADHVDAAEHGDEDRHSGSITLSGRERCRSRTITTEDTGDTEANRFKAC